MRPTAKERRKARGTEAHPAWDRLMSNVPLRLAGEVDPLTPESTAEVAEDVHPKDTWEHTP